MNKIKLNPGLASIIILASIFAGWQTILLVTLLMFAFCDVGDNVKNIAIRVITFYVGYTIVSLGWDLIYGGVSYVISSLNDIVSLINTYITNPLDYLSISKVVAPVSSVMKILDGAVDFLLLFARFGFVIFVLTGKKAKDHVISRKISEYVEKALNFVNAYNAPQTQATKPADTQE